MEKHAFRAMILMRRSYGPNEDSQMLKNIIAIAYQNYILGDMVSLCENHHRPWHLTPNNA